MINQSTMDKLIEMRLTAMADAFRIQMDDSSMKDISFEERFGMLVDVEYTSRKNNRLKRIIRNAELEQPDACIAGIDYRSGRKLNKELIKRLATCEYIAEYRNWQDIHGLCFWYGSLQTVLRSKICSPS